MQQPAITIIINENSYTLSTTDAEAIKGIPASDRQTLIALLESVKQQDALIQTTNQRPTSSPQTDIQDDQLNGTERMGEGDIDALMARLIMEEKSRQKPGLTKQSMYKWVAGFSVTIILLILIL